MTKLKIGLLPLYLKLYIDSSPEATGEMNSFLDKIASSISEKGVDVKKSEICFVKEQFDSAVKKIEDQQVDAIVTLHMAYSPSLESIEALSSTSLLIIILNTTPGYAFDKNSTADDIMYNHGIHGVQDMCNLLGRYDKGYIIESGHWKESDVIDRVVDDIKAAVLARYMSNSRTGIIGKPFYGMGDFSVPFKTLKETIGIEIIEEDPKEISRFLPDENDPLVLNEIKSDTGRFKIGNISKSSHINSIRIGLAVRKWIEKENLDGYSINFSEIDKSSGFPAFPFLEASKAMARGIGYAGEGDVLTASLTAALMKVYPDSSFTEMFCPDWKGGRIFLSHMGEMNSDLAGGKPELIEKVFPFMKTGTPVLAIGQFRPGEAVLVNLAPARDNTYNLIVSQINMVEERDHKLHDTISGWFEPPIPINDFLSEYSRIGGTHHSALVYGDAAKTIETFGKLMGWNVCKI